VDRANAKVAEQGSLAIERTAHTMIGVAAGSTDVQITSTFEIDDIDATEALRDTRKIHIFS
jgi:hypothetical protein